jgi:hypothetical protein
MHTDTDDQTDGPLLISLGHACKHLGVSRTSLPKDETFPRVIKIADRKYVERRAYEAYVAGKLGHPVRTPPDRSRRPHRRASSPDEPPAQLFCAAAR